MMPNNLRFTIALLGTMALVLSPRTLVAERFLVQDNRIGYIDASGQLVIPLQFEQGFPFTDGLAAVRKDGKMGFIDESGKWAIEPRFEDAKAFSEGLAPVRRDGKWGFIDREGRMIVEPIADAAHSFSSGMACITIDNRLTFVLRDGTILPARYTAAAPATEGLAAVEIDGAWGYIDPSSTIEIPPRFEWVDYFQGGVARVIDKGTRALINRKGEVILAGYDQFGIPSEGHVTMQKAGMWGLANANPALPIDGTLKITAWGAYSWAQRDVLTWAGSPKEGPIVDGLAQPIHNRWAPKPANPDFHDKGGTDGIYNTIEFLIHSCKNL